MVHEKSLAFYEKIGAIEVDKLKYLFTAEQTG